MDTSTNAAGFARLNPTAARAVIAATGLLLATLVGVTISPVAQGFADKNRPGEGDVQLYRAEIDRIRAGSGYYEAAAAELTPRGYPTASVFNWRTPLPMWLIGRLPSLAIARGVLGAMALAGMLLTFEAMARDAAGRIGPAVGATLLLTGPLIPCVLGDLFVMPVLWAGVLILLSIGCYGVGRNGWGVAFGLAAVFFRELAMPYALVAAALAVWQRRWREVAAWSVGLAIYLAWFGWHAWTVLGMIGPGAAAHEAGWLRLGGAAFVLSTAQMSAYLLLLPQAVTAVYFTAAMLGLAGWPTPLGQRVSLTVCSFVVLFAFVGQPLNQYWGSLFAPLLCLAVARAPGAARDLLRAASLSRRKMATAGIVIALLGFSFSPARAAEKRIGQEPMILLSDGRVNDATELCRKKLRAEAGRAELLFNLALALGQQDRLDEAEAAMQRALDAGLPPGRFLAGPRQLTAPLTKTATFRRILRTHGDRPIHGPMLGAMTDRSVRVWVRTAQSAEVRVRVAPSRRFESPIESPPVRTEPAADFTAVAHVDGLHPATRYVYDVLVDGHSTRGPDDPAFRTFPTAGRPARFTIAMGGGAGYTPRHERMWETILAHHPAALLLLGDNVYIDNPTRPDVQRYTYYRRQSRREFRRLTARTPVFAIWDDHDFGTNDCWVGPGIDQPAWKPDVWHRFRLNWNNPGYGGGSERPGCWFRFAIADVDFFMLDGRYYRTDPRGERPTMLGPAQLQWLREGLRRSRATLKVLASPVPWTLHAKGRSLDTWRGYQRERDELFSFLAEQEIGGVVLLSADRHRSDYWRIERPRGEPLYEFTSSRLTNIHRHQIMPGAEFGYNEKCSTALLTFDTTAARPELIYHIYSIDNELIHTARLRLTDGALRLSGRGETHRRDKEITERQQSGNHR